MAANPAVPFGFRPASLYESSPPNYAIQQRAIAYNNTNKIGFGDPVIGLNTGFIDLYTNGTSHILGIMCGPVVYASASDVGGVAFRNSWSAPTLVSTNTPQAGLITDPNMVFIAQYIGSALTVSSVGMNVDITTSTSGAPNAAGISVCSLGGTADTTATKPFRIIGIVGITDGVYGTTNAGPIPGYIATNDNQFLYVKFNTSELLNTTGV